MRNASCWTLFCLPLTTAAISACGDSAAPGAVIVTAAREEIAIGESLQLVATVLNASGATISDAQVTWSSSDSTVVFVSAAGVARGLAAGTSSITASSGEASGQVGLRVLPPTCTAPTDGTIAMGQTRSGTLTPDDCILFPDGPSGDGYRFAVTTATSVQIDLASTAFDAVVLVTDLAMNYWAYDDDGGGGTNARVITQLPPGTYIVWATSYSAGETGAYELEVSEGPRICSATDVSGQIAPGDIRAGALTEDSCRLFGGYGPPGEGWQMTLGSTTSVQLDLRSAEFDAVVAVATTNMELLAYGDGGGAGTDARLVWTLPAGSYIVWASSWGGLGAYELEVTEVQVASCYEAVGTVVADTTVTGALEMTDCQYYGSYGDPWRFNTADSVRVQIDLESPEFDTFLVVSDTLIAPIAWDDDGGTGTNSRLVFTFAPGAYDIWALSYDYLALGNYALTLQSVPAGAPAAVSRGDEPAKWAGGRDASLLRGAVRGAKSEPVWLRNVPRRVSRPGQ